MDYIELNVAVTPLSETATDVLAGMLADIGYESFVPNQSGMSAYIDETLFDEVRLKEIISDFFLPVDISYSVVLFIRMYRSASMILRLILKWHSGQDIMKQRG